MMENKFSWRDTEKYYINLDHRTDRLAHMKAELSRAGLEAERIPGMLPEEYKGDPKRIKGMLDRVQRGAIGCHFSQVRAMKWASVQNKSVMIFEDDLVFCSDIQKRLDHIEGFVNTHEWDVVWLGGTWHTSPPYWHGKGHPNLPGCTCTLGKDYETTDDARIVRTYGCFSTFAYIVNVRSIQKIMQLFDKHLHESIGIDWLFIRIQPELKTYAFTPGCVKQIDNRSDIGNGMTIFSGFSKLGKHWFKDLM